MIFTNLTEGMQLTISPTCEQKLNSICYLLAQNSNLILLYSSSNVPPPIRFLLVDCCMCPLLLYVLALSSLDARNGSII